MDRAGTAFHVSFKQPSEHSSNQIWQQKSMEFTFLKVFLLSQVHKHDEWKGPTLAVNCKKITPLRDKFPLKKKKNPPLKSQMSHEEECRGQSRLLSKTFLYHGPRFGQVGSHSAWKIAPLNEKYFETEARLMYSFKQPPPLPPHKKIPSSFRDTSLWTLPKK